MEPERKIEKLLRAYADKRRAEAGDPLTLHPANRRILQGEAARRAPAPAPPEPGEGGLFQLLLAVSRRKLVFVLPVIVIAFLAFLYLPALNSAKREAQSIGAANHLKEIGAAARKYAEANKDMLPATLDAVTNALATSEVLIDPATRKPFVYAGAGKKLDEVSSNTVLAYSPADEKGRAVLFGDGRVETATGTRFAELTNQKPLELARADKSARKQLAEAPPATVTVAQATPALPPPGPAKVELARTEDKFKADNLEANAPSAAGPAARQPEVAKSQPVATPAPIGAVSGSFGGAEKTTSARSSLSANLPALADSDAVARDKSFYRLTMQTNLISSVVTASQSFAQLGVSTAQNRFRNNVAPAQATRVLQSFQVQQNGDAISVVDDDGSVYDGTVQPETAAIRNEPARMETPPGAVALRQNRDRAGQAIENQQQAAQNYSFRVAGMNRTLKQNVVFTGNFLANNAAPQMVQTNYAFDRAAGGGAGGGGAGESRSQQAAANASQQAWLSNSRIVGTAVVASTNQIEVNAVPVMQ